VPWRTGVAEQAQAALASHTARPIRNQRFRRCLSLTACLSIALGLSDGSPSS